MQAAIAQHNLGMSHEQFARMYDGGRPRTIRFLRSRGFSEEDADEMAQAAWARGWEQRAQIRNPSSAVPWVNTIALNLGRNSMKRAGRRQPPIELPVSIGPRLQAFIDVRRALGRLPERERTLLERRYLEELDIEDLAREQNCSRRAMRIRLFRARRALRDLLEAESPSIQAGHRPRTLPDGEQ